MDVAKNNSFKKILTIKARYRIHRGHISRIRIQGTVRFLVEKDGNVKV